MPRYADLFPEDLDVAWAANAPAILPWGALEWHGPHLPLGLDGTVAGRFSERLSATVGGILLPTVWLPMTTLPHRHSLQVQTSTFRAILDDTLGALASAGARTIAVVTGHYAQGHLWELYDAAERAMHSHANLRVLAATPLEPLGDDDLLDHAGFVEACTFLALGGQPTNLADLPATLHPHVHAVLGQSPAHATAAEGETYVAAAQKAWKEWLQSATRQTLRAHYANRRAALAAYRDRYFETSWEQAIESWWSTKAP